MPKYVVVTGDFFGDNRPTENYRVVSDSKHDGVRVVTFVAGYPAGNDNPADYAVITNASRFFRGTYGDTND